MRKGVVGPIMYISLAVLAMLVILALLFMMFKADMGAVAWIRGSIP